MTRGFGWRPNRPDERDRGFHLLAAHPSGTLITGDIPPAAALEPYAAPVRDQGQKGRCVGMTFARLIDTRITRVNAGDTKKKIDAFAHPYPSEDGIYAMARAIALGDPNTPLTDEGAEPRDAGKAITAYGWMPEAVWPTTDATVNDRPTWDALQAAGDVRTGGYYWIALGGSGSRSDDVARALASGYPVGIGFAVDWAFNNYTGGILGAPSGEILGLHMTSILGYEPDGKGGRNFRGTNSWGTSWGEGGRFIASEAWLNDPRVADLVVLTLQKGGIVL